MLQSCIQVEETAYTGYVNPFVGAVSYGEQTKDIHGYGKTFPGAATPYGLVQLSPDTRTGGDNASGYSWNHTSIEGFSFTHMSGTGWYGDLGNFLVMPTTGTLYTAKGNEETPEKGYRSRFSHENEKAEAGYYSVLLTDYHIEAELTTAPRAGILRFTFPESDSSRIQIDLSRRIGGTSTLQYVRVENDSTITGWMKCPPEGGGWGNGEGNADYTVYFCCRFSKPLEQYGIWSADIPDAWPRKNEEVAGEAYQDLVSHATVHHGSREMKGKHLGFYTNFETGYGEQVLVKSGISFVSIKGARKNLEHEIPHWDFDWIREQSNHLWEKALSRVRISGGTEEEKTIFYSSLYHSMIDPRIIADVDGSYRGADGRVQQLTDFLPRTLFSGWDVYRSQFPLQTIINPEMVNDQINSLLQTAELSGKAYLPRWDFFHSYSGCMIGNPAVSVINDAYQKGIRNYDVRKAYLYCRNSVERDGNGKLGYVENMISHTLEHAYTDWCMGRFAESLGKESMAAKYYQKSLNYKNIWDEEVEWFRGKNARGLWREWEGISVQSGWLGQGCVESNPLQQGWFVPHDIEGLAGLMGSREVMLKKLTAFFEASPDDLLWNDYYNHANEPVHHVPYIFNELGVPHLTQKWTRTICKRAYGTDAFGLCGNEDMGQMSAWYVLAAMGIHPVCPGDNKYQITSPLFEKIEIDLDSNYYAGEKFTIIARNNSSENIYIQSVKLNNKPVDRYWITHEEIANGGTLVLEMGPFPDTTASDQLEKNSK